MKKTHSLAIVPDRAGEEGSAYIITLMVMFALTVIGLGLSLVSQTEMLVGSQERTIQRNFYAADSGLSTALANVGGLVAILEHHQAAGRLRGEAPMTMLTALIGPLLVREMFQRAGVDAASSSLDTRRYVRAFLEGWRVA